ncbi:MAG: FtsX-like permease family protein, partial [Longimicrobiales bacterium]
LTLQVAVSMVLVVGAGLLSRSLANVERVDPGFDAERIAVLGTNLQQGGVADGGAAVVAAQVLERIAALPGVERAALTTRLPVQPAGTTTQVVEGHEPLSGTGSVELDFAVVSRGYFETMGMPLRAGRGFTGDDRADSPRVVVVNETAARLFWGGDAVGGRIRPDGALDSWREVVGVIADASVSALDEPPTPQIFYSAEQAGVTNFAIVARTAGDPAAILGSLRIALRDVRPTLPVTRLTTLDAHLGDALAGARMTARLMGAFSLLALLLAGLGVYALVSFSVERRSQELGIRSALGAAGSRLVGMVVGETLVIVALGVVIGLAVAVLAGRGLEGMLYGVGSFDVMTFGVAAMLLLGAAAAAAFLPALRAARTDPVEVLRNA